MPSPSLGRRPLRAPWAALFVVLLSTTARGDTLRLPPVADGTAFDQGPDGTFETVNAADSNGLLSRNLSNRTERALLEFLVPPFEGQTLTAATLSGYIDLAQGPTGRPVTLSVVAYEGDGTLTAEDATAAGPVVATFDVTDLGPFEIPLDLPPLGELLSPEDGAAVGFRIDVPGGPAGAPGVRIVSTEGTASFPPPRLNLTIVPEPSGAAVFGACAAATTLRRRRRDHRRVHHHATSS